jgi:DNA-binding transcriptional regulator LsrR (DeoR family)
LKETFALNDALVLKSSHQPTLNQLGQMTARYLEGLLPHMHTMAVCLGRTTYEVIHAIRNDFQAQVQIVQAIGSLPHSLYEWDSSALARQLAHKLGGDVLYLSSPLMVDSPEAAQVIIRQRDVEHTLSVARAADIALVGIGNLDPKVSGFVSAGFFKDADLRGWLKGGAAGDMGWRIFDAAGKPFACGIDDRVIGLTLDDYSHIPITLAAAAGVEKADAIRGALRTGAVDIIATDDRTATAVLRG